MKQHGDIPDRDEIEPNIDEPDIVPDEAKYKARIVKTILDNGGVAHIYLKNTEKEGKDLHLYSYTTYVFPNKGIIYWHAEDEDHWAFANDITMIERHYED